MTTDVIKLLFPIYLPVLLAGWFRRRGLYTREVDSFLNTVAFYWLLPAVILKGLVYNSVVIDSPLLLMVAFQAAVFILALVFFRLTGIEGNWLIMALRGNIVYFGIPVLGMACTESDFLRGTLFISLLSPVTIALAGLAGRPGSGRGFWRPILCNPFLFTLAAGILIRKFGLQVEFIRPVIDRCTDSLFFISLLIVGGNMESLKGYGAVAMAEALAMFFKLIVLPVMFLIFGRLVGFDAVDLRIGLVIFSAPAAVTNYTMIRELGLPDRLVIKNVMLTTGIYLAYLPLLLKLIGLIR
ncbi:MAG: hypothetical protein PHQ23_03080 [Candidatus Wallbacteria bacterium]|nr:hypothetical protein [Candidatus Wallbacteria bacterium]